MKVKRDVGVLLMMDKSEKLLKVFRFLEYVSVEGGYV